MKELFIVRHGETEWNIERRMQGSLDSPLSVNGIGHAAKNGETLAQLGGVDLIWSSTLDRTRETARIANTHLNAPIEYTDALKERDCGEWGGLTIYQIEEAYPEAWREKNTNPYWHRPPSGENFADMRARVKAFLANLQSPENEFEKIALITHGVMSKVILKYFLPLSEAQCCAISHPNNVFYHLIFSELAAIPKVQHFKDGERADGLLGMDNSTYLASVD